ncbi:MAG: hypothetical protein F4Y94_02655 [Chloroflexi bacterium]|nr:hypothetical protein [Chloroflexota bacterium]
MVPHLQDRAASLAALGWTGRDAEWLALVCLHSGVFLRAQYLSFCGQTYQETVRRFLKRCGGIAVEQPWNGSRKRLYRIASRPVYRALDAEHVRHRRAASPTVVLRRLLSLDYVLEHAMEPWLATETEKVAALTAAGVSQAALPRRRYEREAGSTTRYFAHKLPIALDAERATFVFVQAEDETARAVRTWGQQHAPLWSVLRECSREVEVVVVGRDPARLAAAEGVLAGWRRASRAAPDDAAGQTAAAVAEMETLRAALATLDMRALDAYGGLNAAARRLAELEKLTNDRNDRDRPAIDSGRTWRSTRVPA